MKKAKVAVMALLFAGIFFPQVPAQGTFSLSQFKSFQSQTITCLKGSAIKRVTGTTPKCPTGYKEKNVITVFPSIKNAQIDEGSLKYRVTASSGLAVRGVVIDSKVCKLAGNRILYIRAGLCRIRWIQSGNTYYAAAHPVLTTFKINQMNKINFALAPSYEITLKAIDLIGTSSSSLPLTYQSTTPTICNVLQNQIQLLTPGQCTITATQSGNQFVEKALPVNVSFNVVGQNAITFTLPNNLLLALKTYTLNGNSSSGLDVTYESLTSDICSISTTSLILNKMGTCSIRAKQTGNNFYHPAQTVDATTQIVDSRVTADQPDTATGFQLKAIYVVPSDGTDHSYDTNGYIASILDESNSYLKEQLGLQLQVDRTTLGYDVEILKSNITTAEMMHSTDLLGHLLGELKVFDDPGNNRKNYTFLVDVPSLKDGTACGYGRQPGMVSIVAIGTSGTSGTTCSGPARTFQNYASLTLVHENFHNFGVGHFNDSCDLMGSPPTCQADQRPTIDKERTRYVGASAMGVGDTVLSQDLLKLNVWEGYTTRTDMQADCALDPGVRLDGLHFAYCPTGTQKIGALTYCQSFITSDSLEENINGSWISIGAGNSTNQPWGTRVSWKCDVSSYVAPSKQLTVTTPGVHHYRWIVNGSVSEYFNVIWVQ